MLCNQTPLCPTGAKAEATLSKTVVVCVYLFCCPLNTSTHAAIASWHLHTFKTYFLIGINRSSRGQSKDNVYQILVISAYALSFGWPSIDFHFVNVGNHSWRIVKGVLTCYSTRGFLTQQEAFMFFHHYLNKKRKPVPCFPKIGLPRNPSADTAPCHTNLLVRHVWESILRVYLLWDWICFQWEVGWLFQPPIPGEGLLRLLAAPYQCFWVARMLQQIRGNPLG